MSQPEAGERAGEAKAGQRRGDDVEGVGGIAAMACGVGQRADDVRGLDDRAGPAVGDDQWQRARLGGADVHKVHVLAVDDGGELRKLVQLCLVGAPVVIGAPVGGQVFQVAQRHAGLQPAPGSSAGQRVRASRSRRSSRSASGMSIRNGRLSLSNVVVGSLMPRR